MTWTRQATRTILQIVIVSMTVIAVGCNTWPDPREKTSLETDSYRASALSRDATLLGDASLEDATKRRPIGGALGVDPRAREVEARLGVY